MCRKSHQKHRKCFVVIKLINFLFSLVYCNSLIGYGYGLSCLVFYLLLFYFKRCGGECVCLSVHIFPCAGAETEIPPAPATWSNFLSCTTAFFIRINHEALFASPLLSWKLVPFTINEVPSPYKWPEYLAWSILSSKNICEQAKDNNKILVQKWNIQFSYVVSVE